jgi:DNA replication and repair protein RecF
MNLKSLSLQNFRSYKTYQLKFSENITAIAGPNTVGKTNILESIHLLATGDSFRANKIDEMITWKQEVGRVTGRIRVSQKEDIDLEVVLTRGQVQGKKTPKRRFLVNGVARRKSTFVDNFLAVTFLPEHLQLISGSPSRRRNYLDSVLTQIDKEYSRSLFSYEKALRRRNRLLDLIREGETQVTALAFWDQLLIKEGNVLTEKRREFIDFVNLQEQSQNLKLIYDHSAISEKRLAKYAREEVAAGYTLVGPHKDDFSVESKNGNKNGDRDLALYGSRGEQRIAVLWLKLKELDFIENKSGQRPTLLLDDIFSELDDDHKKEVWSWCDKQQTIITTTDKDDLVKSNKISIISLNQK